MTIRLNPYEKLRVTTAQDLIKLYDLKPHPEGGYFRETYRSAGKIAKAALPKNFAGDCAFSTAIYYLLRQGEQSKLHRLKTDEIFHFYLGAPLIIVQIFPDRVEKIRLGPNVAAGETVQHIVPAGCWFGGYPEPGSQFCFVGCTVAPGFEFADFEVNPDRQKLLKEFPHAREEILKFYPPS